jgi:hypothetical protein
MAAFGYIDAWHLPVFQRPAVPGAHLAAELSSLHWRFRTRIQAVAVAVQRWPAPRPYKP